MAKNNIEKEMALSLSELKEILHYCPETGIFTWAVSKGRTSSGCKAGTKHHSGYINIKINKKLYAAHRLAFLYMTGEWPDLADHINRVRDDNRWKNLRSVNAAENSWNTSLPKSNTSGHRCVSWNARMQKWIVSIKKNGKAHCVGYFKEKSDAVIAGKALIEQLHGEFKGEVTNEQVNR